MTLLFRANRGVRLAAYQRKRERRAAKVKAQSSSGVPAKGIMWRFAILGCASLLACGNEAQGGGSGLNTVVVVNQASTNSCELGNYYCERRNVPSDNLLRIFWAGGRISWSASDFESTLLTPLLRALSDRGLSNQIQYVVLSMDIPFQTVATNGTINSTTSALFYGLKPDPIYGPQGITNSYAHSESAFPQGAPATAQGRSFLSTMLTADSVEAAKRIIDQGVSSDYRFPPTPAILEKTTDVYRNIRYPAFDNAIFNARVLGNSSLLRTNSDSPPGPGRVMGYQTGLANFTIPGNTFLPGAIADSLTSYGGVIFGPNPQTSMLSLISAGAAGSYGTVDEPFTDLQKFPDPLVYFYQARGFTLAESYYQSIPIPYLGLVIGEPLAAPFANECSGGWLGLDTNQVLTGASPLALRFSCLSGAFPPQRLDLFIDGIYFQTLTNVVPRAGNRLRAFINGYPITYSVQGNSTLNSIAYGLSSAINAPPITNSTKVIAFARGDRIELRSLSASGDAESFYFLDEGATNVAGRTYRVTYLREPEVPEMATVGRLPNGVFELHTETEFGVPAVIEVSTNLITWMPVWTNAAGGSADFIDYEAPQYNRRFYRAAAPGKEPRLALTSSTTPPQLVLHCGSATTLPYMIQVSTNLQTWIGIVTNLAGGPLDYFIEATGASAKFYRAVLIALPPEPALVSVVEASPAGVLVRIDGAVRGYKLEASTNSGQWVALCTNRTVGRLGLGAESSAGAAPVADTFLTVARPSFLDSAACGFRTFSVDGTAGPGSWLRLTVTRTNGVSSIVSTTNTTGGTLLSIAQQLFKAINSATDLQAPDGVVAEDFTTDAFGAPSFHLSARGAGLAGTGIQARLQGSSDIWLSPSTAVRLSENYSDLQPRNHLYVSTGASRLGLTFSLNTTSLADGFHELTAVAYRGDNVRSQTRSSMPVQIRNSSFSATLARLDLPTSASVQGTYHIQVTANTSGVARITLFSTGGSLATATNQSTATFSVRGQDLGVGLHPFFAIVETNGGLKYRTQTQWVRLIR